MGGSLVPEQDLLKLKEAVDKAKTEESQLVGQHSQLIKTMREDFNCKDLKEAKKYLADTDEKIKNKKTVLETGVKELKTELGW
jgi:hypothetical protein